jgi:chemotaxis protein methyltransferase CheR
MMITDAQFDLTRRLARQIAGIELLDRHREMLQRRRHRLRLETPAMFDSLLRAADAGDGPAIRQFIGLVTTKFTGFFRHPWQFDVAAEHAVRAAQRRGTARLWSAAAATGEEPYSLAIALLEVFGDDDPPVTILATDINEDALMVARQGEYRSAALSALRPEQRARHSQETAPGTGRWRIAPPVRRRVELRRLNLVEPAWSIEGPFDVIFCRNVLMYLEASRRRKALERVAELLASDGVLILDPVEQPNPGEHGLEPGRQGVYLRRPSSWTSAGEDQCPARLLGATRL